MKPYVGSLGYASVEVSHLMSLMGLERLGVKVNIQAKVALWEFARSMLASNFLREESVDVLLLVESDVAFEPADAVMLCKEALQHGVVGATCGGTSRDACWVDDENQPGGGSERLVPVRWLGSGMVAVDRRVLEALCKRSDVPLVSYSTTSLWPFFYPILMDVQGQRTAVGDVQAFCERAREEGFGVYLDIATAARRVGETSAPPIDIFVKDHSTLDSSKEVRNANGRPPAPKSGRAQRRRKGAAGRGGDARVGVRGTPAQGAAKPVVCAGRTP